LRGHYRLWAIVAALGDNLGQGARILAQDAGLTEPEIKKLASLGEYLNYNGYGERLQDLYFDPAILYEEMRPYADPFDFIANSLAFDRLAAGFHHDIRKAAPIPPLQAGGHHAAYLLPDEAWARRVAGIFANKLANDNR
jgi:hypothetical protein